MPDTATSPTTGLTAAEVQARRNQAGPNSLPEPRPRSLLSRIGAQLRDPLVLLLLAAMGVTVALRDVADLAVIALVVALNTTVGVIQEVRADRAVAALRSMAAPLARVVRDGREQVVASAELVPGDLVRIEAGDVVPADARLSEAVRVSVDESALTGESVAVPHSPGDELSAGTVLVAGRAAAVITQTGPASALGRIATLVAAQPLRATPLQRRLAALSRVLAVVAVALSAVVLVSGLVRGLPFAQMLLLAVSLTVAAVPESLPAVVTIALALGAHRMAQRAAIVRRLPAVETLGSVTVVASDKTGTLTEGLMSVDRLVVDGATVRIHGRGYEPSGSVASDRGRLPAAATEAALTMLLCNDADLAPPDNDSGRWRPIGDPMEAALIAAAARADVDPRLRDAYPRLAELPFDAVRLRMTTLHATPDGRYLVACKGAPEALLAMDGPLADAANQRDTAAAAARLAEQGYRVLALAGREFDERPALTELEHDLRLQGLVALVDPIRPGAQDLATGFATAGIRLLLVTGDHPATAAATAGRLGIPTVPVRTGEELSASADVADVHVFARIRPEQKLDLVAALQSAGEVVAMTGDGVNDAPALRRADIGVAMGRGGTEAARQAADLVLADDNLATVAAAVQEGRRIYANIRRFLGYALSGGLAEVLVMLAGPLFGLAVPLLPAQILWINMLTHGLPGVALGAEPADRSAMTRPPRRPEEAILGAGLAWRIALTGTLIAAVSLGAALVAHAAHRPWQSVLFTVLGLAQLWVALVMRADRQPGVPANRWLEAAVALSATLQLAGLWLPPLQTLLGTEALTVPEVATCAAAAALPAAGLFAYTRLRRLASRAGGSSGQPAKVPPETVQRQ